MINFSTRRVHMLTAKATLNNEALAAFAVNLTDRIWNKQELGYIDEVFHPDVKIHSPLGQFKGVEGIHHVLAQWMNGFSKMHIQISNVDVGGDFVVLQWVAEAIHSGTFQGISPTQRAVKYKGETCYRIIDDVVVEYKAYIDANSLSQQIEK